MKGIVLLSAFCFSLGVANAQINKPKNPTPPTSQPVQREVEVNQNKVDLEYNDSRVVNGIELKLVKVEGNSTDQTVTLHFLFNNPKANIRVSISQAYALDFEGDEYKDANSYYEVFNLYTDAPKKVQRTIASVPSKVKSFRFLKLVIGKDGADEAMTEYRNLKIDWK